MANDVPAGGNRLGAAGIGTMLVKSIPLQQESIALGVIRIILAILLPPLGVFLQVGIGLHFWLNILLTLLGYIPGIVHAIWIIARR
ncbi:MAG TPA: YqaE/Pmp3 family membrane protein [Kiloniellaceae bacterium]